MTNAVYAQHQKRIARRIVTERHREAYYAGRRVIWGSDIHKQLKAEVGL